MAAQYDLIVIGSGPGGQRAAVQAAKLQARVAVVERAPVVGGACVSTGTIPSKTLHESVRYLAGLRRRSLTSDRMPPAKLTLPSLLLRKAAVVDHEIDLRTSQLLKNDVELIQGTASFVDEQTVEVEDSGGGTNRYTARAFVIATGSHPARPEFLGSLPTDPRVLDSDSVLELEELPKTLTVLGGGVIGCEYAGIFAALGTKVTLIDRRDRLLRFMDTELTDTLGHLMRQQDITLKLGETLEDIAFLDDGRVQTRLRSGKLVKTDRLMVAMGRTPNVSRLGLDAVGLELDRGQRVVVNEFFQSSVPQIYAVGDVIGFPALASAAMEQGRVAACHALKAEVRPFVDDLPYGIYTLPELSYVGRTEAELTEAKVPYEIGRAEYRETTRGQISGAQAGFVKLLFHRETLELLGVHILGEHATELVHIGQAVLAFEGKVTYFVDRVFNYPTFAECYKIAALNGVNRL